MNQGKDLAPLEIKLSVNLVLLRVVPALQPWVLELCFLCGYGFRISELPDRIFLLKRSASYVVHRIFLRLRLFPLYGIS
jgi:hypothetical protein